MKIIIDTGQDGTIINARVRQKAATEAEWLSKDPEILDGEAAFVRRADGAPVNFKLGDGNKKFSELPYFVTGDAGEFINVMGSELPVSGPNFPDKGYAVVGPGTYTQSGGPDVVVPSGHMGILNWDGSVWYLGSSVALPKGAQPVDWVADFYEKGSVVFKDNATWIADENATSLDEPGVSDVWVKVSGGTASPLDVLDSNSVSAPLSANMGRELDEKIKDVRQGGVDNDSLGINKLTQEARDFIGSGGNISNNPDGEDLTAVDEGGVQVLKFRDRGTAEGLGYKILRLEGNNILSSSDFEADTIHEIRYDFDLDGGKLELPENVTLKFNGGSITNGEIAGDNTKIDAGLNKIFEGVEFSGKFICETTRPEWFGAISYQQNLSTSAWWWNANSEPANGIDSSEAFNKAIELAQISGGKCTADNGIYTIKNTVEIPNYVKLHLPSGSGVFAIMEGDGNVVYEADIDEPEYTIKQNGGARPITLRTNEYFGSESMAIAFNMSARGTAITGGGTISIALSRYTIGVLMYGNSFATVNMVFAPELDVKIIGGSTNRSIPDPDDYVIDLPWDDPAILDLGNPGDYAYSTITKETRVKNNAGTSWTFWCNESEFNTCFRAEVLSNDNRIINLHANVWLDWGFRGIEIVGRDGGWFNQAVWTGTVSDMHSNYISFFGSTVQGLSTHDMTLQSYQVHPKMSSQCRILALYGYVGGIKSGNTWDLSWAPPARVDIAYELGSKTRNNTISIDGQRYLKDEGHYRGVNDIVDRYIKNSFEPYRNRVNMLKFNNGFRRQMNSQNSSPIYRISEDIDVYDREQVFPMFDNILSSGDSLSKVVFDESGETWDIAVDTTEGNTLQGITGYVFRAYNRFGDSVDITLDYLIETPRNQDFEAYAILATTSGRQHMVRKLRNRRGSGDLNIAVINSVTFSQALLGGDIRNSYFMVYSPVGSPPCKIRLVNIKAFGAQGTSGQTEVNYGTTLLRPNAAPKGHVYYDTTVDAPFINVGNSETQVWKKLLTEE